MSRIAAGSAEGAEQGYRPYLQAALLMGLFTFLFLCAEYLYVDVLSRMVSGDRAVLAQNEALGVSAVGFLLYPLAERSCRERPDCRGAGPPPPPDDRIKPPTDCCLQHIVFNP